MSLQHPKSIWQLMRGSRGLYALAAAALLTATLVGYLTPLVVKAATDSVIGDAPLSESGALKSLLRPWEPPGWLIRRLWPFALTVVVLTAVAGVFDYLKGRWAAIATERTCRDLRDRVYDQLQHLPASFHDSVDTGDLVQRCTSDIDTIHLFLSMQLVEVGRGVVLLAAGIPLMLALSAPMTLVSIILVPALIGYAVVFFLKVRTAFRLSDEAEGAMTARLQENLTGIRVVRAFARQDFEQRRFGERNRTYRDRDYRLIRLLSWYWSVSDVLSFSQRGLTLLVGGYWVMTGHLGPAFTLGSLLAFWMYVNRFLWPIRRIGRVLTELSKASVALKRIRLILDAPREEECIEPPRRHAPELTGRIEVEHLSFAHGSVDVLEDVSFRAEPGQTLALLGPSGAGKSTIVNLLMRLYEYEHGSIRLDGHELRSLERHSVRKQIGLVMQEPFLYSKTVRENIRLGRRGAGDDAIVRAASDAEIHESVQGFNHGYDTIVGERGVTLSGGQRQRVAIARALVRDPAILILDDALSAVDTRTEATILQALRRRHGKRTTIVIAHRLSTLARADRIIVIEGGRVVQSGTHEELLAREGLYRRLWSIQSSIETDLAAEIASGAADAEDAK